MGLFCDITGMREDLKQLLVMILIIVLMINIVITTNVNKPIYKRTTKPNYNPQFKDKHKEVDRVTPLYENIPDIIFRNHFITGCRVAANLTGGSSQMILHSYKNCEACREAYKQDIKQVLKESY